MLLPGRRRCNGRKITIVGGYGQAWPVPRRRPSSPGARQGGGMGWSKQLVGFDTIPGAGPS
jgi:hypothetical protein